MQHTQNNHFTTLNAEDKTVTIIKQLSLAALSERYNKLYASHKRLIY